MNEAQFALLMEELKAIRVVLQEIRDIVNPSNVSTVSSYFGTLAPDET